jgi:hypothetical protein
MVNKVRYPKPDRSNFSTADDPEEHELGQYEGELVDGRPFRAEIWGWDGLAGVTYIFSKRDLERATSAEILALLAQSGEIHRFPAKLIRYAGGPIESVDAQGEPMWNFTFHLGMMSKVTYNEGDEPREIFLPESDPADFYPFREMLIDAVKLGPAEEILAGVLEKQKGGSHADNGSGHLESH